MIEIKISKQELYKLQVIVAVGALISVFSGFIPLLITGFDVLDIAVMSIQTQYVTWLVILTYIVRTVFSGRGGMIHIILEIMVVWEFVYLITYPFYWIYDDTASIQFLIIFAAAFWRFYKWKAK